MYCGTSNVVLPVANKTQFPDAFKTASRLGYYATIFNSVEINSTFYKLPMARTPGKWAAETPPGFLFTAKLWKLVTHQKELVFDEKDVRRFFEVCEGFGEKKGCLLLQLPAGAKAIYSDCFEPLLDTVAALNSGWKLAVEFRDRDWYSDRIYNLLESYDCCLVEHDMPKSATPAELPASDTRYMRFHGTDGKYRGSYTDEFLQQKAQEIRATEQAGKKVFVYFNNTMGAAVFNAMKLENYYSSIASGNSSSK
ncbi:MAG: DUF72 domain-containing protein [Chitinophagaceae bacterium]|nr:DUF72 domain-containing protein [Chitinophagaceae bacterium]